MTTQYNDDDDDDDNIRNEEEKAMHIEDAERLITEIEMLKFVLFLVCRNERKEERVGVVCNLSFVYYYLTFC
jgi:hypothetical protein